MFCGSAWEWDEPTQEYYLHLFATEQPDVNWESPAARKAVYESAMEFWLRRGVNGFRIDCVNMYSKGDLPDAPIEDPAAELQHAGLTFCNGPRMGEFLDEMSAVLSKYDTLTVGECPFTPDRNQVIEYVAERKKRLSMVFQFDVVETGSSHAHKFDSMPSKDWMLEFKSAVTRTQGLLEGTDAWTTTFLENHDWSRSISRFASDSQEHRTASGKMLALFTIALSGTLLLYQGQELGMINAPEHWGVEEFKDLDAANYFNEVRDTTNNDPQALADAAARIRFIARDNARTPMQWTAGKNAGFSETTPWMRVVDDYQSLNVETEARDADSVLSFWKAMLKLRKEYADIFVHGRFQCLNMKETKTLCFTKTSQGRKALVLLNFTKDRQEVSIPQEFEGTKMLVSTGPRTSSGSGLAAFEGRAYVIE